MENHKNNKTAEKVLEKIKTQGLKMKPRAFFALKAAFIILAAVLVAFLCLFIFSFITFACRASGACYIFWLGKNGFLTFLFLFPWALVVSFMALFLVLEFLLKKFSFTYKRPIIYSLALMAFLLVLGGFLVNKTNFHTNLWERAEQNRLPFAGRLYFGLSEKRPEEMQFLEITEMTKNGFLAKSRNNEEVKVVITEETKMPENETLKPKDIVVVFGKKEGDTMKALGVKKLEENFRPPIKIRPNMPLNFRPNPQDRKEIF